MKILETLSLSPKDSWIPCTWELLATRNDLEKASAQEAPAGWDQQEHNCRNAAAPGGSFTSWKELPVFLKDIKKEKLRNRTLWVIGLGVAGQTKPLTEVKLLLST